MRHEGAPGRRRGLHPAIWALIGAGTVVLALVVVVVVTTPRFDHVEVGATGAPGISITFADDEGTHTEVWPSSDAWWKRYTTVTSGAFVTVEAPDDALTTSVQCRIVWNDRVVAQEVSDSGEVTCRYEAGWWPF